jgi:pimeloyl-ACP methyl ester carboxylesterase
MTPGATPSAIPDELAFIRETEVSDGIERITFRAGKRKHNHTLLFVHGMWHGAWCWEKWQELFAIWGWDSVSFSLPGHAGSETKRPIRWCTLGYYTDFLIREIERMDEKPVIVGHSLGTALTQRYLKEVGDLPAAVMLAPWLAHSMLSLVGRYFKHDFAGGIASFLRLIATPAIRTPERAASIFLSKNSTCSPEELHSKLGPESILLPLQHCRPFWKPNTNTKTPMLWITAGQDKLIPADESKKSAEEYGAKFMMCSGASHDLMMESDQALVAAQINDWLIAELAATTVAPKSVETRETADDPSMLGEGIPNSAHAGQSTGQIRAGQHRTSGRLITPSLPWRMPPAAGASAL